MFKLVTRCWLCVPTQTDTTTITPSQCLSPTIAAVSVVSAAGKQKKRKQNVSAAGKQKKQRSNSPSQEGIDSSDSSSDDGSDSSSNSGGSGNDETE